MLPKPEKALPPSLLYQRAKLAQAIATMVEATELLTWLEVRPLADGVKASLNKLGMVPQPASLKIQKAAGVHGAAPAPGHFEAGVSPAMLLKAAALAGRAISTYGPKAAALISKLARNAANALRKPGALPPVPPPGMTAAGTRNNLETAYRMFKLAAASAAAVYLTATASGRKVLQTAADAARNVTQAAASTATAVKTTAEAVATPAGMVLAGLALLFFATRKRSYG